MVHEGCEREQCMKTEMEDLKCQIRVLISEKDGFKALAEAEKERRKELQKKLEVANIKQLMDEAQRREQTYQQLTKNKASSIETWKQAAMKEFILRQQWTAQMTDSITSRLRMLQSTGSARNSELEASASVQHNVIA